MLGCAAAWIGYCFPVSPGVGVVHSVFSKAINLRWENGALLSITLPSVGRSAMALSLRETLDLQSLGLRAGDAATLRRSTLTLGAALTINLAQAQPWTGLCMPPLARPAPEQLLALRLFLDHEAPPHSIWRSKSKDLELEMLVRGLPENFASALLRLVGRGVGLTPGCDDLLVGLLATLIAFGANDLLVQAFSQALSPLLLRTTDVSIQMLTSALHGDFPEALEQALLALSQERDDALVVALAQLALQGSSSGYDMLAGIEIGLAYMIKERRPTMIVSHQEGKGVVAEPGVTRTTLAWGDHLMIVEFKFDKGAGSPPHAHPHEQIAYCVSGHFRATVGDEVRELFPGDSFYAGPNVPHGVVALESSLMLDSFTPIRENFIPT